MNSPLVTTDWLESNLTNPDLRIIDIRGYVLPATEPPPHYFNQADDYAKSHIPGATFIDWVREITDPDSPHHAQVAPPARFQTLMQQAGINHDSTVVAYDTNNGMFAARIWWMLNYYGHNNVYVLDGGWDKWIREGRPTTADQPDHPTGNFIASSNPSLIRYASDMHDAGPNKVLLDVRSPKEFAGEASRTDRYGHIPGAINLSRKSLLNPDETLRPAAELRADFEAIGISTDTEVIPYCNGGVSAAYALLALRVAGFENAALYDGSWKDWTHDPENPVT
jgi:thiosulfate/3-mercaptopyruvate sulfurtransferase